MSKHGTSATSKLPSKTTVKFLLVVTVLLFIAAKWPQESAVFVQNLAEGVQAFAAAWQSGGGQS